MGGACLQIIYNSKLFQSKKQHEFSYPRILYERASGENLEPHRRVVHLGSTPFPVFEQLVVVDIDQTRDERLTEVLHSRGR